MSKTILAFTTTLAIVTAALTSTARAEIAPAAAPRRQGLFVDLGAWSAVGFVGVTHAYAPSDRLVLESGVGFGMSGVQLSFMPKLSLGDRHRFVVGAGPSLGILGLGASSVWANADIGYEFRARGGFSIGVALGWTQGLAGCIQDKCRPGGAGFGDGSSERAWLSERASDYGGPQGRTWIGYWF